MSLAICAIIPNTGTHGGNTFVLATAGNGFTADEVQATWPTVLITEQAGFPSDLRDTGPSTPNRTRLAYHVAIAG